MFLTQVAIVKGRGGIATAVAHYERMFRAVGVRSTIVFRGPSADALRAEGFDVIDAPAFITSPLGALPFALGGLGDALRARASRAPIAMIVHSDLALGAMRALLPEARTITPCHSDKLKHKRRADLIITLNAAQQAAAQVALPHVRAVLLGNPYVAPHAARVAGAGAPRLNFVARFTETKDPLAFLRAAAQLDPRAHVRLIGDGPLDAAARAEARALGLSADFAGWMSAPFNAFHQDDILVLPSSWEGLPYLLQEALDRAVPIIASDVAGNRAALNDGAFGALYKHGDPGALAAAMRAALGDLDDLRARAEKGRAALHARYGAAPFWAALKSELDRIGERRHA